MEAPDERILAGILKGARWHGLLEPVREGRGHDCERGGFVALNGVPNPEGELSPGIYCTVELKIPSRTPFLIVPAGAVVFGRDGLHVTVVEDGVAHSRKITPRPRDRGRGQRQRQAGQPGRDHSPVDLEDGGRVEVRATSAVSESLALAIGWLRPG